MIPDCTADHPKAIYFHALDGNEIAVSVDSHPRLGREDPNHGGFPIAARALARAAHRWDAPTLDRGVDRPAPSRHARRTRGAGIREGLVVRDLQAGQACKHSLAAWMVASMLLAGCSFTPTPARTPSEQGGLRLMAQVIDPEALMELLDDDQVPQRIVAVEVTLRNVGPDSYTVTPSRTSLVGPRNQRVRPVEPSALPGYVKAGSQRVGLGTPPFVHTRRESERSAVTSAGEKALHPGVLAPGEAQEGWLYFPISGRRAAEEVARRWQLAVLLEDRQQRIREYLVRIDPPAP
jgi:hypothetical protein